MKKLIILTFLLIPVLLLNAQVCTTTGFDVCPTNGSGVVSNFNSAIQITGTGPTFSIGSKYKFNNAIASLNLDAVITIDTMVNAVMTADQGATAPSIDNDDITDETYTPASQSALFAPRIAPDSVLTCRSRRGYVQFTVRFYTHYTGNDLPSSAAIPVSNLNFLDFDMDGHTVSSNGWFKETGYVKKITSTIPLNIFAAGTELTNGGTITDAGGDWLFTMGSTIDRTAVSRCAEVISKSIYASAQPAVTFRMGYDYKAPTPCSCNCINEGQPTRQYGAKFGCFVLPSSGPLPVSLTNLAVNYKAGISTVSWTTLQEYNLSNYEIQRSVDGSNFLPVGSVVSKNSLLSEQYSFTDNAGNVQAKFIYYKLRIIDRNNSSKYSAIVSVRTADWKNKEIIITPNPATQDAQVRFKTDKAGPASIIVLNAAGQTVLKQEVQLLNGNNSININNLIQLNEGYYTVRLLTDKEFYNSRLLIWK